VELAEMQEALATTHNSQASFPLAVEVAVHISPALLPVDLAVAPAHQMTSSPEPMEHRDKALRAEIRLPLITQPMAQVAVDQEAWAKTV
jgi:hypothetical protein